MGFTMIQRLKIQNFGPIKKGYTEGDGFIPFKRVTAFCGAQGVGKSSVAKLFSAFAWIEKALVRGDLTEKHITQYNRFVKVYCGGYYRISSYFRKDTFIRYEGLAYIMTYADGHLSLSAINNLDYQRPKIIYIPAERNMLSAINRISRVKGIPASLAEMLDDYHLACRNLKGTLDLPINSVRFVYDSLNDLASIKGNNFTIRLEDSASGIQAFTPMYVEINHFSQSIRQGCGDKMDSIDAQEKKRIDKRIEELLKDETLDDNTRRILVRKASDTANKRVVCIVEEPEQNLFPTTQRIALNCLLQQTSPANSQLLFTTHSPYLINYLSLAIKAHDIAQRTTNEALLMQLNDIVPHNAEVDGESVAVYQIDNEGTIHLLPTYDHMPSDSNYLNSQLEECNSLFDQLLDIESRL